MCSPNALVQDMRTTGDVLMARVVARGLPISRGIVWGWVIALKAPRAGPCGSWRWSEIEAALSKAKLRKKNQELQGLVHGEGGSTPPSLSQWCIRLKSTVCLHSFLVI